MILGMDTNLDKKYPNNVWTYIKKAGYIIYTLEVDSNIKSGHIEIKQQFGSVS